VLRTPPPWLEVVIVGRYAPADEVVRRIRELWWTAHREPGLGRKMSSLRFALHERIHRMRWDPVDVYRTMLAADIGIIPVEPHVVAGEQAAWLLKSENRLTMKMALALPVIATPIPSYQGVIDQGSNGFLAGHRGMWLRHLDALRDPGLRRQMGLRARATVLERFSLEAQGRRLIAVFDRLVGSREAANEPFIHVPIGRLRPLAASGGSSYATEPPQVHR
jgi:glycosyltransferase involved in cell wall biosynthesis